MFSHTSPVIIKSSRAGRCEGRWVWEVVVVDNNGFSPGVLNAPVRNSDKLHVVERFSVDPKTMTLTRSYTAEDAEYLKGKYTGSDTVNIADAPYAPGRCQELGFVDYSKQSQGKK